MSNPLAQLETNLGRAGLLLIISVLGSAAFGLVLAELGSDASIAVVLVWTTMPFVAWLISKAAQAQGRNRWLYGLASLVPPLAILAFSSLFTRDMALRARAAARTDES